MPDVLNQNAVTLLAEYLLGLAPATPVPRIGLFVNNVTPDCEYLLVDLTECTCAGYANQALTPGTWTIPLPASCIVECSYGMVTFTLTNNGGGQTVYGHFIYDTILDILWTRRWETPWVVPVGGGVAEVFPFYTSQQCSG